MLALLCFVLAVLASPFKSKSRLEAENAALRHQLIILRRKVRGRVRLTNSDRWFLIQLYRWFPSVLQVLTIIRPETLVRWHRAGFRGYWRWKSRSRGGRPQIEPELRALIRRMSIENPLWGAPRIHGELLKLGFDCRTVERRQVYGEATGGPSQGWRTFLRNHAPDIAAMDLCVVPTITFNLLYALVTLVGTSGAWGKLAGLGALPRSSQREVDAATSLTESASDILRLNLLQRFQEFLARLELSREPFPLRREANEMFLGFWCVRLSSQAFAVGSVSSALWRISGLPMIGATVRSSPEKGELLISQPSRPRSWRQARPGPRTRSGPTGPVTNPPFAREPILVGGFNPSGALPAVGGRHAPTLASASPRGLDRGR